MRLPAAEQRPPRFFGFFCRFLGSPVIVVAATVAPAAAIVRITLILGRFSGIHSLAVRLRIALGLGVLLLLLLLLLTLLFVRRIHDAIVVFSELVITLRVDTVTSRRGVTRQGQVLFHNLLRIAPNLDVRPLLSND